ncbi:hypothetical protein FRACYDRAFT_238750 [Fragilariopsis cylindrus CCMP1102]|uniref:Guanylate cyclase domain-containing protein n=1 Tax=Fragilariopsis cylindrus CCMP1102 TaxID=635003 RepID=A0A1E7FD98_9STRA|nr:hypothetical protein FRACYDRAFT_238750 [Fragilariopsis cylindrus CCMP1102]|eukprot:OEU16162.1 hypothetical protein FRACYDRAFT_238750 [Fragilariopsis cylindrus CCMP1102]
MFFSDISWVHHNILQAHPCQVSDLLDQLYLNFDALSKTHDAFNIETIRDAYVGVCNLVKPQKSNHAKQVAESAIDTLAAVASTSHPTRGFHIGDWAAEVLKHQVPEMQLAAQGSVHIKGKGTMMTFFIKD